MTAALSKKQRNLILAADENWRTVDELVELANAYAFRNARRADKITRGSVLKLMLGDWFDQLFEYGQATTPQARALPGASDGLWRLSYAGRMLQTEVAKVRKAGIE